QRRPPAPAAATLRLLRGRGGLHSAGLSAAARAGSLGGGDPRERDLGGADEGPPARGRARAPRRGGGRKAADRGRGLAVGLRGPDAAPRPRPPVAGADGLA